MLRATSSAAQSIRLLISIIKPSQLGSGKKQPQSELMEEGNRVCTFTNMHTIIYVYALSLEKTGMTFY